MGEIEVQRFEVYTQDKSVPVLVTRTADGHWYCAHDIAPLLAELATLRERTRRRDAATEPPPEGVWVLGKTFAYSRVYPAEHVVVRFVKGCWLNADGAERTVLSWWPLPQTEE